MTTATATTPWQQRIVGSGEESPAALVANPLNYRRHPDTQRAALREMLESVGWVQQVVVNKRTGHLVDGHLRVELAEQQGADTVPVLYVDLSESEERLVLAALDPIAGLAKPDMEGLQALLDGLDFDGDALVAMFDDLAATPEVEASEPRGDNLEALDVSMADPRHTPANGESWRLGAHVLYIGSVHHDWPVWAPYLTDDATFAPYPTPMLAVLWDKGPLVMVQPDTYLAGHVLDKWESKHGSPKRI